MLASYSAILSFVPTLASWLPQLQAALLYSKQKNMRKDTPVLSVLLFQEIKNDSRIMEFPLWLNSYEPD